MSAAGFDKVTVRTMTRNEMDALSLVVALLLGSDELKYPGEYWNHRAE